MYNWFGRTIQAGYRFFHQRWRVDAENMRQDGGAVYLIHHQNMFGPLHAIGLLPVDAHMWSLSCFFDCKTCFEQFYHYTYRERFGWPKALAFPMAWVASRVVPAVLASFRAIPVYRNEANLSTIRKSLDALCRGENLAICLDKDYASSDASVGEVYSGFLMLGKLYYRKTGKRLPFVPMYCSRRQRKLCFAEPVYVEETAHLKDVENTAAQEIVNRMNGLGASCGDIETEE